MHVVLEITSEQLRETLNLQFASCARGFRNDIRAGKGDIRPVRCREKFINA